MDDADLNAKRNLVGTKSNKFHFINSDLPGMDIMIANGIPLLAFSSMNSMPRSNKKSVA